MTYARENKLHIRIDCSDGINDLFAAGVLFKADLAEYPQDNTLLDELVLYWKQAAEIRKDMLLLGNGSQQLCILSNKGYDRERDRCIGICAAVFFLWFGRCILRRRHPTGLVPRVKLLV